MVMGVAVALISDGSVVDTYALGLKDAEKGAGVEADTVFQAASLSKPAFAYCVFQLVQEGKLRLDEPLLPYVTERFSEDPAVAELVERLGGGPRPPHRELAYERTRRRDAEVRLGLDTRRGPVSERR